MAARLQLIRRLSLTTGVLALSLLVLFNPVLPSGVIHFSNDGPLGQLAAQIGYASTYFNGAWHSNYWIGSESPSGLPVPTYLTAMLLGVDKYLKFFPSLSLLFFGLSAWFFAWRSGFRAWVACLTAIGAALNTNPVSYACWGLPGKVICFGSIMLAFGLLTGRSDGWRWWARAVLAGFCTGMAVMEGGDVGAILSVFVAVFAAFQALVGSKESPAPGVLKGAVRVALVALAAAWIASHAVSSLFRTQVVGIAGTAQDTKTKAERWEFATGWSFPPSETLRIVIPGLFGYRLDTPDGGSYWGSIGPTGNAQQRSSGGGEYAGILVVLLAVWAFVHSLLAKSPFSAIERRHIQFWSAITAFCLIAGFGNNTPFYRLIYALPYFSTIRMPVKFFHVLQLALIILFAHGLEGVARLYLDPVRKKSGSAADRIKRYWGEATGPDVVWLRIAVAFTVVAVLGAAYYHGSSGSLTKYLGTLGFDAETAKLTSSSSIREVWTFVGFLSLGIGLVWAAGAGVFSSMNAGLFAGLLGVGLAADGIRANRPWVITYDHSVRYQDNPVTDFLKTNVWENRVGAWMIPTRRGFPLAGENEMFALHNEWLEHQFPFHEIQALDITQMPRMPEMEQAYLGRLTPPLTEEALKLWNAVLRFSSLPTNVQAQVRPIVVNAAPQFLPAARLWQLSNTGYLIGDAHLPEWLNAMFDPKQKRFRKIMTFDLVGRPGIKPVVGSPLQHVTVSVQPQGRFALIENGTALPRAKLYSQWQLQTNDATTLELLGSPAFNPEQTVLVGTPTSAVAATAVVSRNATGQTVSISRYEPKRVSLSADVSTPSILLLNDRWHSDWKVYVDGQIQPLLRCNYLMRGVALAPGKHAVEFRFEPPSGMLSVTLSAFGAAVFLIGALALRPNRESC